ncbi:MAG TPA: pilus assembly protein TadG-related protein [Planctomycetaceae bacterium]|jgi:Flp pilus assembly protein TadG|nr:pilus assembly protein TadG-related protein [Planctomycetaceae bacterium]
MKIRRSFRPDRSRGAILPLTAISIIGLCGFLALSIDLGMLAVARAQVQDAADAAAICGARSLIGSETNYVANSTANAIAQATRNTILGTNINPAEVTVLQGNYHYNYTTQKFSPEFPPGVNENYNLTQVTISHTYNTTFAKVIGVPTMTVTGKSTAAHRPRDVAMVLDYSGSMNNESDLWNCESYLGSFINTPNNTDPVFPQWGPYAPAFSPLATLQCTSNSNLVGLCNVTTSVSGIPALVTNLFQNNRGQPAVAAFSAAPNTITSTAPAGDQYLNKKNTSTTALTWKDITGSQNTAFTGYAAKQGGTFYGYQEGPGYWGKTFFIWPPDPNAANDWRKKFFFLSNGSTPCNNDLKLWSASGAWNNPSGNYVINYKAILNWIVNSGTNPFPSQLRAGNVLFYSAIPTDVPASAYTWTNSNSQIANQDQRFWKEYIDFTLGVWADPFGNIQTPGNPSCSYGPDFTAGSATAGTSVSITGPDALFAGQTWINPTDNPLRPRHRFWFGPATMIQYMLDTGLLPGTAQDISMIAAKLGIQGALQDIQNNHPNDLVSLIMFSRPGFAGEPASAGQFSQPQVLLTADYNSLINALWYPPNSGTNDVRPWDANGLQTPRAHGDYDSNTATSYGLMLAYNQFSSSQTLQTAGIGGWGRKGAEKLVILETDGMANVASTVGTTNNGSYNSYYNTPPVSTISASGNNADTDAINVATVLTSLTTSNNPIPGFSTPTDKVTIQCIVFGAIFEPDASGASQSDAVSLMQSISTLGATVFPSSSTDPVNGYKWCIGTLAQRQAKMQTAFTTVMDAEISIILVPNQ